MADKNTLSNDDLVKKEIDSWFWGLVITAGLFGAAVIIFIL